MPFTFSHPAIVLPLAYLPRRWFSLTGLMAGSMTPDFEYFLRMRIKGHYGHTLSGLLLFDLPLGLLLAFVFHHFVKASLFDNLPAVLRARLSRFRQFDWNKHFKQHWLVVSLSVLIGAASHLFWDAFTHHNGYFVETFPALAANIEILGAYFPLFNVLQHASTLAGAWVIGFALWQLPAERPEKGHIRLKYWYSLIFLTGLITVLRFLVEPGLLGIGNVIVTLISAGLIALTLTPVFLEKMNNLRRRHR